MFNVGDRVVVTSGPYAGQHGTVKKKIQNEFTQEWSYLISFDPAWLVEPVLQAE